MSALQTPRERKLAGSHDYTTYQGYLLRLYVIYNDQSSRYRSESLVKNTNPKYRNGHILKWRTGTFSSFSASVRSFRGRPRPRAGGAWDFGFVEGEGACRTSWPSTACSWAREHGPHVQPYPRVGLAMRGGCTQPMWKNDLQRSHRTVSGLHEKGVRERTIRRAKGGRGRKSSRRTEGTSWNRYHNSGGHR
jgi:hypothetical protein